MTLRSKGIYSTNVPPCPTRFRTVYFYFLLFQHLKITYSFGLVIQVMVDHVLFADSAVAGCWTNAMKTAAVTSQTDVRLILDVIISGTVANTAVILLKV